jgi:hypothetical protein
MPSLAIKRRLMLARSIDRAEGMGAAMSQIPPAPFEESSSEPATRPLALLLMTGAMVVLAMGLCGLLLIMLWPL